MEELGKQGEKLAAAQNFAELEKYKALVAEFLRTVTQGVGKLHFSDGGNGARNVFEYESNGEWKTPPMASKMLGIRLRRGQKLRLQTPGGGGYGLPAERSETARANDLALGLVTKMKDQA